MTIVVIVVDIVLDFIVAIAAASHYTKKELHKVAAKRQAELEGAEEDEETGERYWSMEEGSVEIGYDEVGSNISRDAYNLAVGNTERKKLTAHLSTPSEFQSPTKNVAF
jgi:hypothetical protein